MNGGEIFGWVWFGLCALPFAGVAIYFIIIGIFLLLVIIFKGLYKIQLFHLIYYLTPNEFKHDPEQPLGNRKLSDAFLCSCCNSSLLLYQTCHGWNRIIVNKFRDLFNCLCHCITRRRQTRNHNADLELPISHPLPEQSLSKMNYNKNDSRIDEEKSQNKNKGSEGALAYSNKELCLPEPAAFLTAPPPVVPMSTTANFNSPSSSSSGTVSASYIKQ